MEKEPRNNHSNDEDDLPSEEELSKWTKKFWDLNDPDKPHETCECSNCGEEMQLLTEPAHDDSPDIQYFYCWSCCHVAPPTYDPSDTDDFEDEEAYEDED